MSGETAMQGWANEESQLADEGAENVRPKKKSNTALIAAGVALFLVLGAGAVWYDKSKKQQLAEELQAAQVAEQQAQAQKAQAAAEAASAAALAEAASAAAAATPPEGMASDPAFAAMVLPGTVPAPAAGGASSPIGQAPTPPAQAMVPATELEARERTIADLQGEVGRLTAEVADLRQKLQSASTRPARAPVAKPLSSDTQPDAAPTERRAAKPKPAKDPQDNPEAQARTDYRVYAVVEGQSWVVGKDGEPMLVKEKTVLPDGSRVTRVDTKNHVVVTSTGTIR
ncbi:MAG: hypothetical protein O9327_05140 [Polaromonas sp.]|nr:hypothetical protein [Polaromonas sp.]